MTKTSKMAYSIRRMIRMNILTILTISGVIIGLLLGVILRQVRDEPYTSREASYVNFFGDIFLRMLKALILPLIISSLIAAIGSLDLTLSGKIGGRAICYYIVTTVIAVILGIILVITIKPGVGSKSKDIDQDMSRRRNITTADTLLDLVKNMFPPNVVQACMEQYQTKLIPPKNYTSNLEKWKVSGEFVEGMNILGLVVISIVVGIALSATKEATANLLRLFQETSHLMMKITGWVIWISPIGVIFLICSKLIELESLEELFGQLGLFTLTVAFGILFHGFVILPTIFFIITRRNPYRYIGNMGQAMATAFGTGSSSATLPVTINCVEEKNEIDSRISRFVLPIGATINMDGTALYEAVAAIFIAQVRNLDLSFGNILAISITATAASIGAAGIPQAGLVTIVMVLSTVGLPAEDVALVIAVDWLLDRIRTLVNVLGDAMGAAIVAHLSRNELNGSSETFDTQAKHRSSLRLVINSNHSIDERM